MEYGKLELEQYYYDIRSAATTIIAWYKKHGQEPRYYADLTPLRLLLLLYQIEAVAIRYQRSIPFPGNFVVGLGSGSYDACVWHPDLNLINQHSPSEFPIMSCKTKWRKRQDGYRSYRALSVADGWKGTIKDAWLKELIDIVCRQYFDVSCDDIVGNFMYRNAEFDSAVRRAKNINAVTPEIAKLYPADSDTLSLRYAREYGVPGISDLRPGPTYYSIKAWDEIADVSRNLDRAASDTVIIP